ncbi:MAG: thiamine phosphate synthase [Polyangiaceae bacterium]
MSSPRTGYPVVTQITDRVALDERELTRRITTARAPLAVQLRDKDLPREERRALALRLRGALRAPPTRWGAESAPPIRHLLIVNGDVELACELGADGVHLRGSQADDVAAARRALEGARPGAALVSVACHSLDDVLASAQRGADAAMFSPIFESPGTGVPLGLAALAEACAAAPSGLAIVALGGLTLERARACLAAGARGVAAIRADLTALSG